VPDNDQHGSGDGDEGFEFAASFDQPPVAFAEEGGASAGDGGGLTQNAFK
jgi:hypothetical protein